MSAREAPGPVASAESTGRKAVSDVTHPSSALHAGSPARAIRDPLTAGTCSAVQEGVPEPAGRGTRGLCGTGLILFLVWCVRCVKIN